MTARLQADIIIKAAIKRALPDRAVKLALEGKVFEKGRLIIISIGKAAWRMARAAVDVLGERVDSGVVITKYAHSEGGILPLRIFDAGHPILDENSICATKHVLEAVSDLNAEDTVLFLVSGGGSALFEKPLVELEELRDINEQLLKSGASIVECNAIRKRLSSVKGGRFAQAVKPARIFEIVLSDIIGDPLDMIASGPAHADRGTNKLQPLDVIDRYGIQLSDTARKLLTYELPATVDNVDTIIAGNVSVLCEAAREVCVSLGYETIMLTDSLICEAREAGRFFGSIAHYYAGLGKRLAVIAGGETVVTVRGNGKGGRNQEMCLAVADGIAGLSNVAFFSVGSDGTDGPTDAAGGFVDGSTKSQLETVGIDIYEYLRNNDSYNALEACGGLIKTGSTGTNVNDLSVLLIV